MPTTWPYPRDICVGPWKSISDLYTVLLFALLFLMRKKRHDTLGQFLTSEKMSKQSQMMEHKQHSPKYQRHHAPMPCMWACSFPKPHPPPPRPQRVKPANCPAVLLGQHEGWLPLRGQSDSANLMCCHQGPSRRRAP